MEKGRRQGEQASIEEEHREVSTVEQTLEKKIVNIVETSGSLDINSSSDFKQACEVLNAEASLSRQRLQKQQGNRNSKDEYLEDSHDDQHKKKKVKSLKGSHDEGESENESSLGRDDKDSSGRKTEALLALAMDAEKLGGKDAQNDCSNGEESSNRTNDGSPKRQSMEKPQTSCIPNTQGSKTVYVGNLSFSVEQDDVENFFKGAGEIFEIRFALDGEGAFRGYCYVEFANAEAAHKAVGLSGKRLLGRHLRIELARERGTSYRGCQWKRIFIRGFEKNDGEDKIRAALEDHFKSCGEISCVLIPRDDDGLRGIAYIDFADTDGFINALKLNGSALGTSNLTVEAARRRCANYDCPGSGGVGHRFGAKHAGWWWR